MTKRKPVKKGAKRSISTSTGPKARMQARRDALSALLRKVGVSGLDVTSFAKEHGVTRKRVYEDLEAVSQEVADERGRLLVVGALERLQRAQREFDAILREARTPEGEIPGPVRLGAAKALMESARAEVELLDLLGIRKSEGQGSEANPLVVKMWQPGADKK